MTPTGDHEVRTDIVQQLHDAIASVLTGLTEGYTAAELNVAQAIIMGEYLYTLELEMAARPGAGAADDAIRMLGGAYAGTAKEALKELRARCPETRPQAPQEQER
jgi:hypothetical protein